MTDSGKAFWIGSDSVLNTAQRITVLVEEGESRHNSLHCKCPLMTQSERRCCKRENPGGGGYFEILVLLDAESCARPIGATGLLANPLTIHPRISTARSVNIGELLESVIRAEQQRRFLAEQRTALCQHANSIDVLLADHRL
jgi:hypothetical protein